MDVFGEFQMPGGTRSTRTGDLKLVRVPSFLVVYEHFNHAKEINNNKLSS